MQRESLSGAGAVLGFYLVVSVAAACPMVASAQDAAASPTPASDLNGRLDAIEKALRENTKSIKALEKNTEAPNSECPGYVVASGTAETNCPFYADFTTAVELQQASDFSEPFPRVGFRARIKGPELFENPFVIYGEKAENEPTCCWDKFKANSLKFAWSRLSEDPGETVDFVLRPHFYLDVALSSVAVEEKAAPTADGEPTPPPGGEASGNAIARSFGQTEATPPADGESSTRDARGLTAERSWDMRGGIKLDLVDLRTRVRTEKYRIEKAATTAAVAALEAATEDLAEATARHRKWSSARIGRSDDALTVAELEGLLHSLKRERAANTAAESGEAGFKALARKEVEEAEKAWREAQQAVVHASELCAQRTAAEGDESAPVGTDGASGNSLADCEEHRKAISIESTAKAALEAIATKELAYEAYFRARDRVSYYRRRYYTEFAQQISLALMMEVGARTADVDSLDLWQSHFVGGRVYYRGQGSLNGMFLDVGWGISENLPKNKNSRIKFRSHIPFRFTQDGTASSKAFIGFEVDSDFGSGDDEVRLIIGNAVDTNRILSMLGLGGL